MLAAFSEQMQDLLSPHEYSLETQKVSQRNNCFGILQKRDWNGETRRGEKDLPLASSERSWPS